MVIRLRKDIEERLNELADHEGGSAEPLAKAAIAAMLARDESARHWPRPKVVGITGERDAEERYGPRPNGRSWPKSVGMLSDGGVDAEDFEDWLAENWIRDLEQEMLGASHGDDGRGVGKGGAAASGDGGVDGEAARRPYP